MARRRKQTHDPRQLSLFDAMVHHIEQIRKENIQDDMREEAQSASSPRDEQRLQASSPHQTNRTFRMTGRPGLPEAGSSCSASPRKQ